MNYDSTATLYLGKE